METNLFLARSPNLEIYQTMTSCKNIDQAVLEFVRGCMAQYFLFDPYVLFDYQPDTHLLKSPPVAARLALGEMFSSDISHLLNA